jgi:membrane protease YdiL (CAAX protease family)
MDGSSAMPDPDHRPSAHMLPALVLAMIFPTIATLVDFVLLARGGQANPWQQAAYAAGLAFQVGFPVCCEWRTEGWLPRPGRPTFAGLRLGLLFGGVVALGTIGLYFFFLRDTAVFAATAGQVRHKLEEFGLASPAGFAAFAVLISVPHSLLEEYYWRWFVFGRLRGYVGVAAAMVLSGLAFMAHHVVLLWVYFPGQVWTAVVPFSLCVAAGGVAWAWLYQRTGTLNAVWLSHLLVDAGLFVVGYDLFFGGPG